jgi:glycosyltransferase involved in cell wall biosynthesis
VPSDAFVVAMTANMRRVKGADVLLRAVLECGDLPNLHLVLVGQVLDPEVERLAHDPRLASRVHLVGFQQNASRFLPAADLFVMPSRAEALSIALLESMALGVCAIVSDAGGMKEAVRDGRDGVVFPSENVAALAQAIRRLHGDAALRRRLEESAKQRFQVEFTHGAVARRMAAIYHGVTGDSTMAAPLRAA